MSNYRLKTKVYNNAIIYSYYYFNGDKSISKQNVSSPEEVLRCKLSRSCSRIKDIVLSNNFDYFFTLTLKDDYRYDIPLAISILHKSFLNYSKCCSRHGTKFEYIGVYELTKSGGVHLHAFVKGFYDLYYNEYQHISSKYFDKFGFQNFLDAKKVNENYLIKYIRKCPIYDKQVYFCSRGLNKPEQFIVDDYLKSFMDLPWKYNNRFF